MADIKQTASTSTSSEGAAIAEAAPSAKKATSLKRALGQRALAPKAATSPEISKTKSPSPAAKKRKTYTDKERAQKLGQIEKLVARGETVRNAANQAGVSEQTYYHWKKTSAAGSAGDDLKDLLALEDENMRLKRLLAERLRKENAELKKRLGLG